MSSIQYRRRLCTGTLCGGLRATFSDTLSLFLADLVIIIIQHSMTPVPYKSLNVCHVRVCVVEESAHSIL
jgi:hypothetical protein